MTYVYVIKDDREYHVRDNGLIAHFSSLNKALDYTQAIGLDEKSHTIHKVSIEDLLETERKVDELVRYLSLDKFAVESWVSVNDIFLRLNN